MKIVVTGGAGFIGANLCRRLVQEGDFQVVVLDDLSTGGAANLDNLDLEVRTGSVLDPDAVAGACKNAAAIVHLAAVPSVPRSLLDPRRSHDVNATGTLQVLETARNCGAHVVIASSSSVYGRSPRLPKSEDMVCMPASPYACSKLAAESYAFAYQRCFEVDCTVFRFFNVFGPLQAADHAYAAVIPAFVKKALRGEALPIHGDGTQSRDFTYVESVIDVLLATIIGRVVHDLPINLAFGTRTTITDIAARLSDLLERPLPLDYQPARKGDVPHSQAATQTLRTLFPGIEPVPLEHGLARTIEWMSQTMGAQVRLTGANA
jgi:UDP-glucose 4-epimerase